MDGDKKWEIRCKHLDHTMLHYAEATHTLNKAWNSSEIAIRMAARYIINTQLKAKGYGTSYIATS